MHTAEIDTRALLDELEEPLIHVTEVIEAEVVDDGFDGTCAQHEGCRVIGG